MLLIDEHIHADGRVRQTHLGLVSSDDPSADARLQVREGTDASTAVAQGVLTIDVMAAVMRRYGRPLDRHIHPDGLALSLGHGRSLARLRFRAAVDSSSRDYIVWMEPGAEPLAALGRQIAAALRFLLSTANA